MKLIKLIQYCAIVSTLLVYEGCSSSTDKNAEDPLKNTKKLVLEGHRSLYYQGALEVKGTSIKFIPPFEEVDLITSGKRWGFATSEFSKGILKAKESVVVVKEGTKISWKTAGKIKGGGEDAVKYLNDNGTKPGLYIMYVSVAESYGLIGSSYTTGIAAHEKIVSGSENLRKEWNEWADDKLKSTPQKDTSPEFKARMALYNEKFKGSLESTVYGYVDLDLFLKSAYEESFHDFKDGSWNERFKNMEEFRSSVTENISSQWKETIFSVGKDTSKELNEAKNELDSMTEAGPGPALLKAFMRTTKALFYDAIIKPIGKISILSVGYVSVNGVIYPAAFIKNSAQTGLYCLVETFTLAGKGVVYIVAPTTKLAFSALINSSEVVLNESIVSASKGAKFTGLAAKKASAYSVKGAGVVTEGSGKYILAPLSFVGVTTGQTVVGGGLAVAGTVAGGSLATASAATQTATYSTTTVASGTVGTVGTLGSFGVGTTYGVYQITKAVGIPSGVAIGSGVILSYEFVSHMSAHSLLAVSDCAYLVLSLEGGKWVVYGVKDSSKKVSGLLSGSVIDLDQVRKEGGTVVRVPIDDSEVEKILGKNKKK